MICFHDQTLCQWGETCKKADKCFRAFTFKEHNQAVKWWGSEDYPVCFFVDRPECYEKRESK